MTKPMPGDSGVTQAVLADHLDISQVRVAQFVKEGVFRKTTDAKLNLATSRIAYIRWLRDETRKSSKSASASRVQDARAEEIKLRLEEKRGTLLQQGQAEAINVIDEFAGGLKSDLMAIPARVTADLALRRRIEDGIDHAFADAGKRAIAAANRVTTAGATLRDAGAVSPRPKGGR